MWLCWNDAGDWWRGVPFFHFRVSPGYRQSIAGMRPMLICIILHWLLWLPECAASHCDLLSNRRCTDFPDWVYGLWQSVCGSSWPVIPNSCGLQPPGDGQAFHTGDLTRCIQIAGASQRIWSFQVGLGVPKTWFWDVLKLSPTTVIEPRKWGEMSLTKMRQKQQELGLDECTLDEQQGRRILPATVVGSLARVLIQIPAG